MTTLDSIRWGDAENVSFVVPAIALTPIVAPTKSQLVHAVWHWPLTWTVAIVVIPQFISTEGATFTLSIEVTIGVGASVASFTIPIDLAPPYAPVFLQQFFPSQDLQMKATLRGTPTGTAGATENLFVGLFAAPMTEPHAMTQMLESLTGAPTGNPQRSMEGIGIHEAPPYYQPR